MAKAAPHLEGVVTILVNQVITYFALSQSSRRSYPGLYLHFSTAALPQSLIGMPSEKYPSIAAQQHCRVPNALSLHVQ